LSSREFGTGGEKSSPVPNSEPQKANMPDQILEIHENLKFKLTKELVLKTCWDIEEVKTEKYAKEFPKKPKTFQWPSGWSEWITRIWFDGKQDGLFLKSTSDDTINLCLLYAQDSVKVWDIGYDGEWIWRRNPCVKPDLDAWWLKMQGRICLLEESLKKLSSIYSQKNGKIE
jgi:hypothetical protein